MWPFFWFQHGFRTSWSTADLQYLIELQEPLVGLGLLKLWHLIYQKLLTGFSILVLSLMEYLVRYLALFLLFWVIKKFWMESLHKNIQLILKFLKASFLVLHLFYYILMTFLTMLSVTMISLSILSMIKHLICGNNLNWLLNLNLIYETLLTGKGSGFFISMLGKLNWFCLAGLITLVLLMWKSIGLFLRKNPLSFLALLDSGILCLSGYSALHRVNPN